MEKECNEFSAIKPPIGLKPFRFHERETKIERFNDVCGAIQRYYDAGLKINLEWVSEYNDLIEYFENNK